MDWREVFNGLRSRGYHLGMPNSEDQREFREEIEKQFGLEPRVSEVNSIYILGKGGKTGEDFFGDRNLVELANEDTETVCNEVKKSNPSFQFYAYLFRSNPIELIAKTLGENQRNIGFIDPYQDHKCVVVTWNDERGGK